MKLSNYYLKFYKFNTHTKYPNSTNYYEKQCFEMLDQGEILAFSKENHDSHYLSQTYQDRNRKKMGWFSSSNLVESRDERYEKKEFDFDLNPSSSAMNRNSLSRVNIPEPSRTNQGRYAQQAMAKLKSRPTT